MECMSQYSSVSTATDYGLDDQVSVLAEAGCSFTPQCPNQLWSHPPSSTAKSKNACSYTSTSPCIEP